MYVLMLSPPAFSKGFYDLPIRSPGLLAKAANDIGQSRVAAVCTDSAANMMKGRRLFTEERAYKHILDLRCQLHGFNLLFAGFFVDAGPRREGHPQGKRTIKQAQAIVTFFGASHIPADLLRAKAALHGKRRQALVTSNQTRMVSNYLMLVSVLELEVELQAVHKENPKLFAKKEELQKILSDRHHGFWHDATALVKLLEPLSVVMRRVQSDDCTLADITRHWLYLAKELVPRLQESSLDPAFIEYIAHMYVRRVKELHLPLHRLALFLDPTHQLAGDDKSRPEVFVEICQEVRHPFRLLTAHASATSYL